MCWIVLQQLFFNGKGGEEMKAKIETLSFEEMKDLWRYAPIGHPYFRRDLPLAELFKTRLIHLRDTQGGKND